LLVVASNAGSDTCSDESWTGDGSSIGSGNGGGMAPHAIPGKKTRSVLEKLNAEAEIKRRSKGDPFYTKYKETGKRTYTFSTNGHPFPPKPIKDLKYEMKISKNFADIWERKTGTSTYDWTRKSSGPARKLDVQVISVTHSGATNKRRGGQNRPLFKVKIKNFSPKLKKEYEANEKTEWLFSSPRLFNDQGIMTLKEKEDQTAVYCPDKYKVYVILANGEHQLERADGGWKDPYYIIMKPFKIEEDDK